MNTTILVGVGLAVYLLMYLTYGRGMARSLVRADPRAQTPAQRLYDGVDYVPTNKWVLFGHHFASIAGAAPIVGPAIAMAWGGCRPSSGSGWETSSSAPSTTTSR